MSEHKLPLATRMARGLVGIRDVPRGTTLEGIQGHANRRRKYAGHRRVPWHGLPGDAREAGKLAVAETAEEREISARIKRLDAERAKPRSAA